MSDHKEILERINEDIEFQVMMQNTDSVTMMEEIRRELKSLRAFKLEVRESLKMAMFAYNKNDDFYVKGIIEELIKLESKEQ